MNESNHKCDCGCGRFTKIMDRTDPRRNFVKGQPYPFVKGHSQKRPVFTGDMPLCGCGCGKPTTLSKWSNNGNAKGQPMPFLQGHYPRTLETIDEGSHYRVEERGYETPCFIYCRRLDRDGYGRIGGGLRSINGPERAHVRAYRQQIGPIPEGMVLHHLCENPACVRGDHLRPMTPTEHKRQHSSLTIEIVRVIRASPKSAQKLADEYGVSRRAISLVRQGKTWIED